MVVNDSHPTLSTAKPLSNRCNNAPVVVRFAALGDAVLLTVLIEQLFQRYGQPVALLSSGGWTRTLFGSDPRVSELTLVTSRKRPYWFAPSQREAVRWLKMQTGPVYLCDPDPSARRLVERAVSPTRIRYLWSKWPGNEVHWADWWHSVGGDTSIAHGSGQPRLHVPTSWEEDARAWMASRGLAENSFVLIQPGNKKTTKLFTSKRTAHDKFWPYDRWTTTIRSVLAERSDLRVVICGVPREARLVDQIAKQCGDDRVIAAATELPLPRLVALTARAHSMISVDTGPAHVAAALDCPLVVLFGAFGWQRWAPRAPNSTVRTLGGRTEDARASVATIDAAAVVDAWKTLAPRGHRSSPQSRT
jgi:heptosyltransferase III